MALYNNKRDNASETLTKIKNLARVRVDSLTSPLRYFINPVHWNAFAKKYLADKDFKGRLILYPQLPRFASSKINWVPRGVHHGFNKGWPDGAICRVSLANTTIRPFDPRSPAKQRRPPYTWYPQCPEHNVSCINLGDGFDRIHPSTNVSVVDCDVSQKNFEYLMSMTGDLTIVNSDIAETCVPQTCHARRLTIDEKILPYLKHVSATLLTIIAEPEFDAHTTKHILDQKTEVNVVCVGPIVALVPTTP